MLSALVLVVLGGALALPAAAQDRHARPAPQRHRRRAGRRTARPAERRARRECRASAEKNDSTMLVLQLAGTGAVDANVDKLVRTRSRTRRSRSRCGSDRRVPTRRARARCSRRARRSSSVAPGAGIGPADPLRFDEPGNPPRAEVVRDLRAARPRTTGRTRARRRGGRPPAVGGARPTASSIVNSMQPTVGDFIVSLDGKTVTRRGQAGEARTADVVGEGKDRRRQPNQEVRFHKLDLGQQLAHTLDTPVGRVLPVRRRPRADRLRVLHRGSRHRRVRRCGRGRSARASASRTSRCSGGRSRCCCSVCSVSRSTCRPAGSGRGRSSGPRASSRDRCRCTAVRRGSIRRGGSSLVVLRRHRAVHALGHDRDDPVALLRRPRSVARS